MIHLILFDEILLRKYNKTYISNSFSLVFNFNNLKFNVQFLKLIKKYIFHSNLDNLYQCLI